MISVLCPSRHRPTLLARSLTSLDQTATGPIELLVAADPDDPETAEVAAAHHATVWVAPQRFGYRRLHDYYTNLARLAGGTWLLVWNDDAVMETVGWDEAVGWVPPEFVVWTICGGLFPAVPKVWVDHLGYFAREWHNDAYWEGIGARLGRIVDLGLDGTHEIPDDGTSLEARKRNPGFYDGPVQAMIDEDTERIRGLL